MDKKISIRLKEDEYKKIEKMAKDKQTTISEFIRNRAMTDSGKESKGGNSEVKRQMLIIKKQLDLIAGSYKRIDFQPIEDAMEVIWDELY